MPGQRQVPPRLGLLAKPALALGGILLALLLAELAVRLSGRVPEVKAIEVTEERFAYRRSDNPILSFELRPDYRNDAPDLFQTYERTNSHGQRDRERDLTKPDGHRRILLLGDSVVEGSGVREEQTISRQLEALSGDETVEVLNFGVSGYCTRAEVELLETKGLAFSPDTVILLFVENDFNNFNAEAFQLATRVDRPAWAKQLFLRSESFRLAALQLNLFEFGAEQDPMRWNKRAVGSNNVVDGLRRLRTLAEREGFRTLLAIWPRFDNDGIVDLPSMPGDPDALVIERLAAMNGIPTVRLSDHYRRLMRGATGHVNPRLEFTIGDRMHPSPRGCTAAAEGLKQLLDDRAFWARAADEAPVEDPLAVEAAQALSSRAEPNYARVFTRLGNAEREAGRPAVAIEHYRKALEEDAGSEDAHINLGDLLRETGDLDEAVLHYHAALKANPDAPGVRVALGLAAESAGQPIEARSYYESQLERNPGDPEAHLRLGNLAMKQGRPSDAIPYYERSLAAAPDAAGTHNNLGLAHERLGDLSGAVQSYESALELDAGLVDTHNNLGIVRARQEDYVAAAASFGEALRLAPQRADVRVNLVAVLERLDRPEDALRHLEEGRDLAGAAGDLDAAHRFEAELEKRATKGP